MIFKTIVETLREPLVVLDARLRIVMASRAFYRMFEVGIAETEDKFFYNIGNGLWRIPALTTLLEDIIPTNSVVENFEVSHDFEGHGPRTMLLNARRIEGTDEQPELILLAIEDVTARWGWEKEREQLIQELTRSNEELERFAFAASHDLQEPLRMVANYTQLLARKYEGKLDEKADRYIAYATDGARRMQTLINGLLLYSRVGRGGAVEVVDSKASLEDARHHLLHAIRKTSATITSGILPHVLAYPPELMSVFQNLLSNALKFHGAAPPHIHVSAKRANKQWVFSVQDNGIGIEPQYFDRLFVMFQRLHTATEYPGTGLGLAISKKIIERLGGLMWVESEPGKGSCFNFSLPILESA